MDSTPLKKGFRPTSTPIRSFGDSGYFGSCNNSSSAKAIHTLSPIKEFSPSKRRYTEIELRRRHLETPNRSNFKNNAYLEDSQYSSSELIKELNFNDLSDFFSRSPDFLEDSEISIEKCDYNEFPSFQMQDLLDDKFLHSKQKIVRGLQRSFDNNFLQYSHKSIISFNKSNLFDGACKIPFTPVASYNKYEEQVASVRLKSKKIDFFEELNKINCSFIISNILTCLSASDLCRICCVNKRWKSLLLCDVKANLRRKEFLREENARKENKPNTTSVEVIQEKNILIGERKTVLSDVINMPAISKQPLEKQYNTKFDSFVKEGQNMKKGILMKCPACHYAAKSKDEDKYFCTQCNYIFCQRCLNPFLKNHVCPTLKVSILIGSKGSKKSLKRL